ncbi:50S ribosomal protein L14 [Candidatus Pacearchaeota archaeon CG_4_9_14_3_um_filter_31_7]|nr:MAG: hypothetical protein AUJ10_00880 [Candidatus Pacearchaeota archaeon CG1_02_31_27]PIN92369.1 MAG: 50S ribosomal protein L14 [Candidatus Pacearchaeota archaeon CG10_big_fil_rev_8_21_14_0_10_31_59]PIZ80671.1 MAG: 50S ribosomal protein L14 [Candidatus Pacearchaeota archaeon CG_4_10_14_0_2_um_filter_31_10]PJA70804.1 MAG: 50S ribosomal protein L14 [Candidatus Pacearchaeota archaeon CG_4_9_14_3_um_filter_31_7]
MKAVKAKISKGITIGTLVNAADNSGAKIARIVGIVSRGKTKKSRNPGCGVSDLVLVSIRKGTKEMRKQTHFAVIVRQKKAYQRLTGERLSFEDNAVVILKDREGNPKGTQIKGVIGREVTERWPFVTKIASLVC